MGGRRHFLGTAVAIAVATASAGQAVAAECDAPKPNLQLSEPARSVSPAAAAFQGVWGSTLTITHYSRTGSSNLLLCVKLYVSVKDNRSAAVAFCRGSLQELGRVAECKSFDAAIVDGALSGVGNFTFKPNGSNSLSAQGVQQGSNVPLIAEFRREQ